MVIEIAALLSMLIVPSKNVLQESSENFWFESTGLTWKTREARSKIKTSSKNVQGNRMVLPFFRRKYGRKRGYVKKSDVFISLRVNLLHAPTNFIETDWVDSVWLNRLTARKSGTVQSERLRRAPGSDMGAETLEGPDPDKSKPGRTIVVSARNRGTSTKQF